MSLRDSEAAFDIVLTNGNPQWDSDGDADEVARYWGTGLTWWNEDLDPWHFGRETGKPWPLEAMRRRVLAGPPRFRP